MPRTEAQKRATTKWNKANMKTKYDRISFFVPAGNHEVVKKAAEAEGVSVNLFIQQAILDKLQIDEWPVKNQPSQ